MLTFENKSILEIQNNSPILQTRLVRSKQVHTYVSSRTFFAGTKQVQVSALSIVRLMFIAAKGVEAPPPLISTPVHSAVRALYDSRPKLK